MLLLLETPHITDLHGFGSLSWAVSLLHQLRNFQFLWEIVCSLLCAKEPATGPYPVSTESSAHIVPLLLKHHFNFILLCLYRWSIHGVVFCSLLLCPCVTNTCCRSLCSEYSSLCSSLKARHQVSYVQKIMCKISFFFPLRVFRCKMGKLWF